MFYRTKDVKFDEKANTFTLHSKNLFFFYMGFLSQIFTIHRVAGKGGGYFFNSSLPLLSVSQTLRY